MMDHEEMEALLVLKNPHTKEIWLEGNPPMVDDMLKIRQQKPNVIPPDATIRKRSSATLKFDTDENSQQKFCS